GPVSPLGSAGPLRRLRRHGLSALPPMPSSRGQSQTTLPCQNAARRCLSRRRLSDVACSILARCVLPIRRRRRFARPRCINKCPRPAGPWKRRTSTTTEDVRLRPSRSHHVTAGCLNPASNQFDRVVVPLPDRGVQFFSFLRGKRFTQRMQLCLADCWDFRMLLWRPPQRKCSHQLLAASSTANPRRVTTLTIGRHRCQKFPVVREGMLHHPAEQDLIVRILQSESLTIKCVEYILLLVFLKLVDQGDSILQIRFIVPSTAIF